MDIAPGRQELSTTILPFLDIIINDRITDIQQDG